MAADIQTEEGEAVAETLGDVLQNFVAVAAEVEVSEVRQPSAQRPARLGRRLHPAPAVDSAAQQERLYSRGLPRPCSLRIVRPHHRCQAWRVQLKMKQTPTAA